MNSSHKKEDLLGPWASPEEMSKFKGDSSHKFLNRNRTINSNWKRINNYAKEFLHSKNSKNILDIGSGNGSTMEIFRHFGHNVQGMDFSSDHPGSWLYEPMFKSQKLNCKIHSGSNVPYPFEDNSYDLVICWGVITAFRPVSMWPKALDEMSRISRGSILLAVNVGKVFDEGKPLIDGWNSEKHKLCFSEGHIYKWDIKNGKS